MLETIEFSLYLLEYGIYNSFINFRKRLHKRKPEPVFDSEILEAYK
ncbi:MAG: hypothetical protein OES34_08140 [Nitrosopumilus sp.]|nr:hypothetical protein [Nitrosopumilus sp.]